MDSTKRPIYGVKQQSGQTKTYLYTKGKQFSLRGVEYIGPYHIFGSLPYTGGERIPESERLQPYYENQMEYDYDLKAIAKFKPAYLPPNYYKIVLKEVDYEAGYFFRYFIQKVVDQDAIVYELSEAAYGNVGKANGINDGLYNKTMIQWKLTGPLRSQIVTNILPSGVVLESEIDGIIDFNQKQVLKANTIIPGLMASITDYAEFARPSNFSSQLPISTSTIDSTKILRNNVPSSVKKVFIKALNIRQ